MYLNIVMSSLNIRGHFDYIKCIQNNNLTKPELVSKIREKFGSMTAAVVGDRSHDIEAARKTGALSIGVLYGYGGEEPNQADITISKFDELLNIFDKRLVIFETIAREVEKMKQKEKAFVIGINGIDGAGKTEFAASLETYLKAAGYKTQLIHLDDFHNSKMIRYAGEDEADNYYNKSFDINLIVEKLLSPIKENKPLSLKLKVLNLDSDKYEVDRENQIDRSTIVIFEGEFLFRKELAPYIDYKIFLDIPLEESKRRAIIRDPEAIVK